MKIFLILRKKILKSGTIIQFLEESSVGEKRNFKYLCTMIDCSRNAVMTVDALKDFIAILSRMGYNRVGLYMEDTYTIEGEDYFGYMRGKYSPEELKAIDDFAFSVGVEVIPFIQTLGHLNQMFQWEKEYDEVRDHGRILLADCDKTYELIEKMISSVKSCFRTDCIHLGMDEAFSMGKGKYREIHGDYNLSEVFIKHVNRVCDIAKKCGFEKFMSWGSMFGYVFQSMDYKNGEPIYYPEEFIKKVPENLTISCGDYYHVDEGYHDKILENRFRLTKRTFFNGSCWKWTGWVPQLIMSERVAELSTKASIEKGIEMYNVCLWGDNGGECSNYAALPTLCQVACANIGITDREEVAKKFYEWTGVDYDTFFLLNLPDFDETRPLSYVITPSKYQLYNDCFMGMYDGGVDKDNGKLYREISNKIKASIDKTGDYSYVFETIVKLCDVLEIKAELGIKTHKVYFGGDKSEFKQLIADYEEVLVRIREFYKSFRTQWYKENKPQGFDVQDIRIGGLLMRIENCMNTLKDYCDGKIDKIPELHEEQLPIMERRDYLNDWLKNVTANVLAIES